MFKTKLYKKSDVFAPDLAGWWIATGDGFPDGVLTQEKADLCGLSGPYTSENQAVLMEVAERLLHAGDIELRNYILDKAA